MNDAIRPDAALKLLVPGAVRKILRTWLSRFVALESPLTHADFTADEWNIIRRCEAASMGSYERLVGLIRAIDYLADNRIAGDIVECGVFQGGTMLAAALRLKERGDGERGLWLYDTFEGMPAPDERDVDYRGTAASDIMVKYQMDDGRSSLTNASLDRVKAVMASAAYPGAVHYIEGKVEDTLPGRIPERLALLRLDTDWYASTKHELEHLYPRLAPGGVLIVDDYGHFQGARQATDEYIAQLPYPLHLSRMDYTGRIAIKPWNVS